MGCSEPGEKASDASELVSQVHAGLARPREDYPKTAKASFTKCSSEAAGRDHVTV